MSDTVSCVSEPGALGATRADWTDVGSGSVVHVNVMRASDPLGAAA
jgi:hypothetical protein